ncbi:LOG family protein [Stratiformator vulcanicus]|uniref:AMP nucleosidase n=1 Tax=Stratiformator vulcanicus TaxID=2527980 RepID=A0A517R6W0_9PLAN|nr:LOG family protein [Stratiformator vulcanicus]QDT39620.1 LOG family protein YgdH [Stratiformator vulcanicus]
MPDNDRDALIHNAASENISLGDEDATLEILRGVVFDLWRTVGNLTRLQPSKRPRYRVSIFGSARIRPEMPLYQDVKRLAFELANRNCDIITGGGPGLMQAANEGEMQADPERAKTRSVGIRVDLDFEQETNAFVEEVYVHRTFFSRLHHFVMASDAFVVVPGGIGTTLELMMIWQLLQVRKLHDHPLILVGDMWERLVDWVKTDMVDADLQTASPGDEAIPTCVSTVDEALALLIETHEQWKSR